MGSKTDSELKLAILKMLGIPHERVTQAIIVLKPWPEQIRAEVHYNVFDKNEQGETEVTELVKQFKLVEITDADGPQDHA